MCRNYCRYVSFSPRNVCYHVSLHCVTGLDDNFQKKIPQPTKREKKKKKKKTTNQKPPKNDIEVEISSADL